MKFSIDFIPRRSWQQDIEPCDQRWTRTPNVFVGTEEQATIECSELEAAYDRQCVFRAVPIETDEPETRPALASTQALPWAEGKAS